MKRPGRRHRALMLAVDLVVVAGLGGAAIAGATVLDGGALRTTTGTGPTTTTTVPPTTTTTTVPPTTAAAPTTAAPTTVTTTTVAPRWRAPLTGLPIDDATFASIATRRTLAVKIDDAPKVLSHPGLGEADIVYEVLVEGGLTRYLALFQSRVPATVGPVRSVRTTDAGLVVNLNTPVLAFSGGNPRTVADVMRLPIIPFPPDRADRGVYRRDNSLPSPHNMFLSPAAVWSRLLDAATPVSPFANERAPGVPGTPTAGVRIVFSGSTDSTFVWDAGRSEYARIQRGRRHTTDGGRTLTTDNVVVLSTPYGTSPYDARSPEAVTVGFGTGLLLSGGTATPISWARPHGFAPFTLLGADGAPLPLPPGRTWAAMVPAGPGRVSTLDGATAAALLGAG